MDWIYGGEPALTNNDSTRQVARHAGLSVVGLVIIGLVRFAEQVGASAFFGVEALAWVTASISIATLATVVGPAGLSAGITKLTSELRGSKIEQASGFVTLATRLALLLTVVGAIAGGIYARFDPTLGSGDTAQMIGAGVLTLAFGLYLTGKSILYGEEQVGKYVRAETFGGVLFVLGMALVVIADAPRAIVLPLAVAYVPVGWVAITRLRGTIGDRRPLPVRPLLGYGAVGSVGSLSGVGFTRATPLVAGFLAGVPGAALVGAALAVLEPLYLAPRAIGLALLPRLSFERATGSRPAGLVKAATGIVALAVGPFCALLIFERERILQIVFSDQIVGGITLAWFSAAFFVSVVGAPAVTSLAAIRVRDAAIPMWSSVVGFATAAAIWAILGSRFGTEAVAFGYFVGSVIQVAPPLVVSSRRYELRWGTLWARLATGGAGAAALAVLAAPSVLLDVAALAVFVVLMLPEVRIVRSLLTRR